MAAERASCTSDKGINEKLLQATEPANPQCFLYFSFLFTVGYFLSLLLAVAPFLGNERPFKVHGGIFMLMTMVSLSVVVLASGILVFTSNFLQSWMKDVHYTILKTIGCFFSILALFSLGAAIFVPDNLDLIAFSIICLVIVLLLGFFYVNWKYVCAHQENKYYNTFPVHWTGFLLILPPLLIVSPNLRLMF